MMMMMISRRKALDMGSGIVMLALLAACSSESANMTTNVAASEDIATAAPVYAMLQVPVGKAGPADYAAQLGTARTAGHIKDVVLLQSKPSVEGPLGFATLAIVTFKDEASWNDWNSNAAAKLGRDVEIKRADMLVDARAKTPAQGAAYVVNYYSALIPATEYKTYTEAYISPNMDMQKASDALRGYAMYHEHEPPAGRPAKTILVKEYASEAAFDRFLTVKDKNKVDLLKNPEWKRINDTKESLRKDISGTLATPVPLP